MGLNSTELFLPEPLAKLAMAAGHAMLVNLHLNRLKTTHFLKV